MPSPVNILLCVNPLASNPTVDERVLYQLVDRIAPVSNIAILSREGAIKAFLQFDVESLADRVIRALDGTQLSIGRLAVYRSHKAFVSYGQSPEEARWMFGARGKEQTVKINPWNTERAEKSYCDIESNLFKKSVPANKKLRILDKSVSEEEEDGSSVTSSADNHIGKGSGGSDTYNPTQLHGITVTHSDPDYLHVKMIKRLFRRYGRIFNLSYDPEHQTWNVQFGTKKSAKKIAKRISLNKMFGYTIFDGDIGANPLLITKPTITTASHEPSFQEIGTRLPEMVQPSGNTLPYVYLRIDNIRDAEMTRIVKAVSTLHTPSTVVFGFDGRTRSHCCLVGFQYIFQAAETFVSVTRGKSGLSCRLQLTP